MIQNHDLHTSGYHSYLLRLWQDGPQGPWRASLCDVATSEWINFAEIASLLTYLRIQTEVDRPPETHCRK